MISSAEASKSQPEKRWVGRSFSLAAAGYDQVAGLQRDVGDRLLFYMGEIHSPPGTILDAGAGTGYCSARLVEVFPQSKLIALDIAEGMLHRLRERAGLRGKALRVCADGECMPFGDRTMDLVFSNLALQWCPDPAATLAEFRRVLRPGGVLAFSSFGEATLGELRRAWAEADGYSHVNAFAPVAAIEGALRDLKFGDIRMAVDLQRLTYPRVEALLRELKSLGAHNVTANRARHLTGKGVFRKMLEAYASSSPGGRIEASFEIIHGCARLVE